jgi:predicted peptidase
MKKCGMVCKAHLTGLLIFFLVSLFSCQKESSEVQAVQNRGDSSTPPPPIIPVKMVLSAVARPINRNIGGYYAALPSNYSETSSNYPLLVYMHGLGQVGNGNSDLGLLLKDGVAEVINDGKFPGTFTVNGRPHSFIVLVPQSASFPGANDINDCISFAKKNWRIDPSRIYVSGLSAGSMASCDFAAEHSSQVAALVAMAGVSPDYATTSKCQRIAAANTPVWVFHSKDDPQVNVWQAMDFVSKIASSSPSVAPKLTLWEKGGHDAWTKAVDPGYKENGMNIYEWMLHYHR